MILESTANRLVHLAIAVGVDQESGVQGTAISLEEGPQVGTEFGGNTGFTPAMHHDRPDPLGDVVFFVIEKLAVRILVVAIGIEGFASRMHPAIEQLGRGRIESSHGIGVFGSLALGDEEQARHHQHRCT